MDPAIGGSLSWLAGAAAVFKTSNGAGAVALIAAGAFGWLVALIGRWPTKVTVLGSELAWDQVAETLDTQIEAAKENDEDRSVLRELRVLRQRLNELQQTGFVSEHPAATYDRQVRASIQRVLPNAAILAQTTRTRNRSDFSVQSDGRHVLVETKWRADKLGSFRGSTLKQLTGSIGPGGKLLVASNLRGISSAKAELHRLIGDSGRVVSWRSSDDDAALATSLSELLTS